MTVKTWQTLLILLGLGIGLVAPLALVMWSHDREREVRQVVLSAQGCLTAAQLSIPTTLTPGGCIVEQPGMHKYADEVTLADGKSLSAGVVTGWSK